MQKRCFIGFDGFIDTLANVVKSRKSNALEDWQGFSTISEWASSLQSAAQKSCNYELACARLCAGGNAINLARALSSLGHQISCAANIGSPSCHEQIAPVFLPHINSFERMVNLGAAGQTHALEFNDGKLLLGIQGENIHLGLEVLEAALGKQWHEHWLWNQDLIALVNWTMTPNMGQIWQYIAQNPPQAKKKRFLLIDLADPKKRAPEDLAQDLSFLVPLNAWNIQVVLSLNKSEAEQTLKALGGTPSSSSYLAKDLSELAQQIRQKLPTFVIVIHDSKLSVLSQESRTYIRFGQVISQPLVLTGGGDHFNAGLAHGLLQEQPVEACLDLAMQCAGYYIEKGKSPRLQDLS
jgi:sugar/nucleoside kinase (ribokinase family)